MSPDENKKVSSPVVKGNVSGNERGTISPLGKKEIELLKLELLRKIDLFSSFNDGALRKIIADGKDVILKKGEILFEEGHFGSTMYIILSGEMLVYKKNKPIAKLGPGQFLGEMSILESKARSASIKALSQEVILMEIREEQFARFLCSDPQALMVMLKCMSNRIRQDLDVMSAEMQKLNIFSHDMRNCLVPLQAGEVYLKEIDNAMSGTHGEHKKRKGWELVNKSFEAMLSARNNVATLIDQSLGLAKKVKKKYIKEKTDLVELIRETIHEVSYHKFLRNKSVELKLDGRIEPLTFNPLDIKRVMQNLLINAGYATRKQGTIQVLIKDLGGEVQVSVEDRGVGIPDDIKPLLLNESLTTKPDGNGFGLLSCRDIVEEYHQGKIWFESVLEQGTTFHYILPKN